MELLKNKASSGGLLIAVIISFIIHAVVLLFFQFGTASAASDKQAFYVTLFEEVSEETLNSLKNETSEQNIKDKKELQNEISEAASDDFLPEEGAHLSFESIKQLKDSSKYSIISPFPVKKIKPVYPIKAKRLGIEGSIVFKLKISPTGKIVKYSYISSGYKVLDDSAVKYISKLHFNPGLIEGKIYGMTIEYVVNYKLV